jgi:excinuclease ABC subunit C
VCFDISTTQGTDTVGSCVWFENARPRRSEYRKFKVKTVEGSDDFASMHEVVLRYFERRIKDEKPLPDLIVIDGGKGQLEAAYQALEQLGLSNLVAIGIAKKEELIYTREHADAIALASNDPALLLIQQIRDEAHRFAVTFHRRARTMRDLRSELDHVPGIGPRRRRTLLTTFGSLAGVRRATREELSAVVGAKVADAVLAFFASRP